MATIHHELASAKLTRTLRITGRREDGYHLLSSEMVSLDLADELEIEEGKAAVLLEDAIAWSGAVWERPRLDVPSDPSNLVLRALRLAELEARIRLVKHIPAGAGLGGGSSDAAAVLRWAGLFETVAASTLGADVPFCLRGGRALVSGIGEVIEPLAFERLYFVVVTPGFSVSTPAVYRAFDELGAGDEGSANDLEHAALAVEPRLKSLRAQLELASGRPPTLAGSGASFFFECTEEEQQALAESLRTSLGAAVGPVVVSACRSVARLAG